MAKVPRFCILFLFLVLCERRYFFTTNSVLDSISSLFVYDSTGERIISPFALNSCGHSCSIFFKAFTHLRDAELKSADLIRWSSTKTAKYSSSDEIDEAICLQDRDIFPVKRLRSRSTLNELHIFLWNRLY
jgi:hypothetical protein